MSQSTSVTVAHAKVVQDFIKHPGMTLLTEKLREKMKARERAWLGAKTPEDAEAIRQDSRAYGVLMGVLNEFLVHGAQAEKALLAPNYGSVQPDQDSKAR